MNDVKQVIVIRRDLKMRQGKAVAQGAHAACSFLVDRLLENDPLFPIEKEWIKTGMKKITCRVDSFEEFKQIKQKAIDAKLQVYVITDAGHTEFHGEPTITAMAIGPAKSEMLDKITGHLQLL